MTEELKAKLLFSQEEKDLAIGMYHILLPLRRVGTLMESQSIPCVRFAYILHATDHRVV